MTQKAIITDLNRCIGCLACIVACKAANGVPVGEYWTKIKRVGPNKVEGQTQRHGMEMYFLSIGCQHCYNPTCVEVCPTGASYKAEDGTVQIDSEVCIGCKLCVSACPYGARTFNEDLSIVQKCTLCSDKPDGELPACVAQCCGRARWVGDLDEGYESFEGPANWTNFTDPSYEALGKTRTKMLDYVKPWEEADEHRFVDEGNNPAFMFVLRENTWQEGMEKA